MHDDGQLPGKVSVVGFHLIVILLLVLFDQALVNAQAVAACLHKVSVPNLKKEPLRNVKGERRKNPTNLLRSHLT